MLELDNVSVTFNAGTNNEVKALKEVSLTVDDGDFVTVIGSNGAGKKHALWRRRRRGRGRQRRNRPGRAQHHALARVSALAGDRARLPGPAARHLPGLDHPRESVAGGDSRTARRLAAGCQSRPGAMVPRRAGRRAPGPGRAAGHGCRAAQRRATAEHHAGYGDFGEAEAAAAGRAHGGAGPPTRPSKSST